MPINWNTSTLEIDLTNGTIEKRDTDVGAIEKYLGGRGTNVKILWDRVPPETDPSSPDNLVILGTGILTGTMVPSANRLSITFKSPQMGIHSHSSIGGFIGPELKHAGYDTVIIKGKSPGPVYLLISDERVEIRDAGYLRSPGRSSGAGGPAGVAETGTGRGQRPSGNGCRRRYPETARGRALDLGPTNATFRGCSHGFP